METGRHRAWVAIAVVAVTAVVSAGCGSRLSYERLRADAPVVATPSPQALAPADTPPEGTSDPRSIPVGDDTATPGGTETAGGPVTASTRNVTPPSGSGARSSGGKGSTASGSNGAAASADSKAAPSDGSGSGSDTPSSPAPPSPTGKCTAGKTPIKIGSVGAYSGIVGLYVLPAVRAIQAWVASVNANGGVACHLVQFIVKDSGGDPSRNQAAVQQLVEQEKVIGFVYMGDPFGGDAPIDYINAKQIPVIGSVGVLPVRAYQSPMVFPQMDSGDEFLESGFMGSTVGKEKGLTKLATVSCAEASICSTMYGLAGKFSKKYGMDLVYNAQTSLTLPDYTSVCQAAQSAGAQTVMIALDGNSYIRFIKSCKNINYRPQFALFSLPVTAQHAKDANLDGALIGSNVIPFTDPDNAALADFRKTLDKYSPGTPLEIGSVGGWLSAKVFERAVQNISDPPTSQSILAGLRTIKNEDFGGMTSPLTFTEGQRNVVPFCWWAMKVSNSTVESLNRGARTCQ